MEKFNREDVKKAALDYFNVDSLSADVWINKYALKDSDDNIYEMTPDDMHYRIASEINRIESKYPNALSKDKIFDLIKDFKYIIPQGGSMSGIGNNLQIVSLSNCFVVGNTSDSYGGIARTDEQQVQLMKRRGGVGHDLSHIRPKGSPVKNSALTSTGVVPFMERYSNSTREVAQDGRRGALMLSISIKHPDAEDFIDAKLEQGKVTGANISVKITDEFMDCVINNKPYRQQFPIDSDNPKFVKEVDAKKLWNKIVHNAWKSAEPGILFWDNISNEAIPDMYGSEWKTVSTNPCLTGDSKIMTSNGEITIKEIFENFNNEKYEVLTYNENTKQLEYNEVGDALLTKRNANIIELELEDGELLRLTPEHKVFTENRGWVEAAQLTGDDILLKIK